MKVLLALDSSTASETVINEVASRPWHLGTVFCVMTVVDTGRWEGLPALIEDAKRGAQTLVATATGKLIQSGQEAFSEIQLGLPKIAIPQCAKQWGADLIVIGSYGTSALTRFLLGSVAQAVLRTAPCSVEIVRPTSRLKPTSPRGMRILLATDGSDCSETAAQSVASRLWPSGSQIRVISVREIQLVCPPSLLDEVLEDVRKNAEDAVRKAEQKLSSAGLKLSEPSLMPVGDPRSILVDEADSWGADLVVLGSHGRHVFDRVLLGSVSEAVAMHAYCSVEVIRS